MDIKITAPLKNEEIKNLKAEQLILAGKPYESCRQSVVTAVLGGLLIGVLVYMLFVRKILWNQSKGYTDRWPARLDRGIRRPVFRNRRAAAGMESEFRICGSSGNRQSGAVFLESVSEEEFPGIREFRDSPVFGPQSDPER